MWNVIEQMMPVGLGARQCHRSPLLQEGSDACYGLPEGRFLMRFGFCSPLPTPYVLGADVEGARLRDGDAAGTSMYSNISWLQAAEAEGAQSGLCLGAGQCPAVPSHLGIPPSALETETWEQERLAEMGSSKRTEPAMRLLHGANMWRTLRLPFMSLNLVLLYFHACRRRKKEGYLLSVHSQALKSWG